MNDFRTYGGQQYNAPGGTQNFHGIPPEQVTRMVVALNQQLATMQTAIDAQTRGITDAAMQRFVQQIARETTDTQQAVSELRNMLEIAIGVQDEGARGSNLGDFVDAVLRRRAELSADGRYEDAIAEIDAALAREEAESQARRVRLLDAAAEEHLLAFDAAGAAARIARRVELETPDPAARFDALRKEQDVWYERGRDRGVNLDLRVAVALADITRTRADTADRRGEALNDLGNALLTLGARETGTERLEQAVDAYRAALEEITCDRVPLDWARTQMNLGAALQTLGARETGTERLEQAVAAYRAALTIRTRDRVPLDWARTQVNLGNALGTLGAREAGTERLEEAVTAFRAALEEYTRDRVPLDWARTQMNLGNALRTLGTREAGTDRLEQAVAAYRAALEEWTRDRVPLDWARTQMGLGNALADLGAREPGTERLEQAVAAYRAALEENTRDRVPLDWAVTQMNLGTALRNLGARETGTERLEQAVTAYRAALEEITRDRVPLDWAMTQMNLGTALQTLGARETGTDRLDQAVDAYRAALTIRTRDRVPLDWALTRGNMALVHRDLFDKTGDNAELDRAQAALDDARGVFAQAQAGHFLQWADSVQADIDARRGG